MKVEKMVCVVRFILIFCGNKLNETNKIQFVNNYLLHFKTKKQKTQLMSVFFFFLETISASKAQIRVRRFGKLSWYLHRSCCSAFNCFCSSFPSFNRRFSTETPELLSRRYKRYWAGAKTGMTSIFTVYPTQDTRLLFQQFLNLREREIFRQFRCVPKIKL